MAIEGVGRDTSKLNLGFGDPQVAFTIKDAHDYRSNPVDEIIIESCTCEVCTVTERNESVERKPGRTIPQEFDRLCVQRGEPDQTLAKFTNQVVPRDRVTRPPQIVFHQQSCLGRNSVEEPSHCLVGAISRSPDPAPQRILGRSSKPIRQ